MIQELTVEEIIAAQRRFEAAAPWQMPVGAVEWLEAMGATEGEEGIEYRFTESTTYILKMPEANSIELIKVYTNDADYPLALAYEDALTGLYLTSLARGFTFVNILTNSNKKLS